MKKLGKMALFALFLLATANAATARDISPTAGAKLDGQRSLAATREMVIREIALDARPRLSSPRLSGVERLYIDRVGPDSIVQQQFKKSGDVVNGRR